ncbi:MAG: 30S ribosomal protein S8 [Candidatus Cloacimonetes bacterium]|nr:30S ribosomal protein S8 [Candidatus Cloacimonadota bacterium]
MSVSDSIADAITKIRNAYRANLRQVTVNHSKLVESIVRILNEENYINSFDIIERNPDKNILRKQLSISLRYTNNGEPVMKNIQRVSTPGRRVYVKGNNIPAVYNNTGCAIISTNKGVMVDREARKTVVGGEYVCKVW